MGLFCDCCEKVKNIEQKIKHLENMIYYLEKDSNRNFNYIIESQVR